jgi:ketosteroid isomerase-like protein
VSSDDNISTIKTIYDAFGAGDVDTILDNTTDDVDWAIDAAGDAAPWYGVRSGKEAVAKFFAEIDATVDVLEFAPQSFAAGDNEVMTLVRFAAKSKATGREYAANLHHYWHFSDGHVDRFRGSDDTEAVAKALNA